MLNDEEELMRQVLRMPAQERTAIAVQAMAKTMFEDLETEQWDEYWEMIEDQVKASIMYVMEASIFGTGEEPRH